MLTYPGRRGEMREKERDRRGRRGGEEEGSGRRGGKRTGREREGRRASGLSRRGGVWRPQLSVGVGASRVRENLECWGFLVLKTPRRKCLDFEFTTLHWTTVRC